jgi:hypothetical protein
VWEILLFRIALERSAVARYAILSHKAKRIVARRDFVFHQHLALPHWTVKLHGSESVQHLYEITQQVLKTPHSMIGYYHADVWV